MTAAEWVFIIFIFGMFIFGPIIVLEFTLPILQQNHKNSGKQVVYYSFLSLLLWPIGAIGLFFVFMWILCEAITDFFRL